MTKPVEQPTEPTPIDAQIEALQKAKFEQVQAKRQACKAELMALADDHGFLILAMPKLAEVTPGAFMLVGDWGLAEKAK